MKRKLKALTRLYSIYCELGYIPWHKVRKPRKERRARKKGNGVYMGTREAIIPFLNDDSKRTFSQLLLRPGYLMRDYILRGKHESYLAPLTWPSSIWPAQPAQPTSSPLSSSSSARRTNRRTSVWPRRARTRPSHLLLAAPPRIG